MTQHQEDNREKRDMEYITSHILSMTMNGGLVKLLFGRRREKEAAEAVNMSLLSICINVLEWASEGVKLCKFVVMVGYL